MSNSHFKLSSKQIDQVVKLYQSGKSSGELASQFNVSDSTILRYLEYREIERRSRSEINKKYQINDDIFNNKKEESSYWIGFLLADGSIEKRENRLDKIKIGLGIKDKSHLEKFNNFLGTDYKIYTISKEPNDIVAISVTSNKLVERLSKFGIVPNKVKKANPQNINNNHFWRGVVDGDGYLSEYSKNGKTKKAMGLAGSRQTCVKFKQFVKQFSATKASISKASGTFQWRTTGNYAIQIAEKLYKNSSIYLERKYKVARRWLY